jgi:hypothetical protein
MDPTFADLPWYRWWVRQQIHSQPERLLLALPNIESDEERERDTQFLSIWDTIRSIILAREAKSIEEIANKLGEYGVVSFERNYEAYQSAKELVFSIIGWQTMLYKPDFFTCTTGNFTILDDMDGYRGETRLDLSQPPFSSRTDLPSFLLRFGMMLPPRDYCAFSDAEGKNMFESTKVINSKDLSAHVLTKICGIRLQWVDSLSCHLELDSHSGTLFLYRYPSFCVSNLHRASTKERQKGVLHYCGLERPGSMMWADEEDIVALLQEILLSYRLLFGQSRRSRALFRRLRPFARIPHDGHDQVLSLICGRKHFNCPADLIERDEYDLTGDFPHLRSKLLRLNSYASSKKPRSIQQLWRDKRDSTAWLAFWSVLIFGSLSILLGIVQTAFQILQYVSALRQVGE